MAGLLLDDITVPLRSFDLRLTLAVERTVALVGPSGAGKTTVLRTVAGLTAPRQGRITVGSETWFDVARRIDLAPDERRVGLVFQEYALFPHLTVRQNIEYARRHPADEYLERFGIAHLQHERPTKLSGGERQRVALARALARDPAVLLLDEPLSALDAHTKAAVRAELHDLLGELEMPSLIVTHDYEDAAALADSVGVIVDGELRQVGTPADLVARPADAFVASFTGANLLHGRAGSPHAGTTPVALADGTVVTTTDDASGDVTLAVYPWEITLSLAPPHDSAMNVVAGTVRSIVELGNRARVTLGPLTAELTNDSVARLGLAAGQTAYATFKATGTRVVVAAAFLG
jgi:molybdate transport system ATP-binding protein